MFDHKALLHTKNQIIMQNIRELSVKDKRRIFAILRKHQPFEGSNYILPQYQCMTLGEFCVGHLLQSDTKRKK